MSNAVPSEMRCLQCGYDLRGLESMQCPECGEAFDPGDTRTFTSGPIHGYDYLAMNFIGLLLMTAAICVPPFCLLWFLIPISAVMVVFVALWKYRRGVILKHGWVLNPGAMWIGCIVGSLTLLVALCFGLFIASLAY